MKKNGFTGGLYGKNMWSAAKSFTTDKFNYFMGKIEEKDPSAQPWLDDNHPYVGSRSKFFEDCKVDYINNNLSDSSIVGCPRPRTTKLLICLIK